jgi:hypothetical protein
MNYEIGYFAFRNQFKCFGGQIMNIKEEEEIRQIVEKNRDIIDAMKRLSDSILEDKVLDEKSEIKGNKDIENDIKKSDDTIG